MLKVPQCVIFFVTAFLPSIRIVEAQYFRKSSTEPLPERFHKITSGKSIPVECGNGVCDTGENCHSCPLDCISGTSGGFECGNGICEDGETCYTCPQDCNSETVEDNSDMFCCHGGTVDPQIDYGASCTEDIRCAHAVGKCSPEASPFVNYCCGDGTCNGEETHSTCAIDKCLNLCGNRICDVDQGESADSCAMDCHCNLDGLCDAWESSSSCPLDCSCGNNICDKELGETADNCPHDCTKGCDEMEDTGDIDMYNEGGSMDMDMDMDMYHEGSMDDRNNKMGEDCKENGESCSDHSDCCSSACDFVCEG